MTKCKVKKDRLVIFSSKAKNSETFSQIYLFFLHVEKSSDFNCNYIYSPSCLGQETAKNLSATKFKTPKKFLHKILS